MHALLRFTSLAVAALALAACSDDPATPAASTEPADNFRRLFVSDNASGAVRAYNLSDLSLAGEMTAAEPSIYFYATGSGRFIVNHQRSANRVDVVDAGVFAVDQNTAVRRALAMLHTFRDSVPIHGISNGNLFAVFFDGTGTTQVFDETRLAAGNTTPVARIVKGATHGASLGLANRWIVASPPVGTTSPLPAGVNVYNLQGQLVDSARNCPSLHGAHANATAAVFGCLDGILAGRVTGTSQPVWSKLNYTDTRFRTGTVWGRWEGRWLLLRSTIPGQPTSNTTRRLGLYDSQTGTMDFLPTLEGTDIEWTAGLSANGALSVALGRSGTLYVYDNATRTQIGRLENVVPGFTSMPSGVASWLEFSDDRVFISAPTQNQVVEVRIGTAPQVLRRLTVPGVPTRMALAGVRGTGRFRLQ
ncbi:MAG: hypothetical protein ACK53A_06185 [Gemmatimonadota bacterium]|jgi:hypothetical protein|nr:hypothetical protein [Gemmatimonadota bacterium]